VNPLIFPFRRSRVSAFSPPTYASPKTVNSLPILRNPLLQRLESPSPSFVALTQNGPVRFVLGATLGQAPPKLLFRKSPPFFPSSVLRDSIVPESLLFPPNGADAFPEGLLFSSNSLHRSPPPPFWLCRVSLSEIHFIFLLPLALFMSPPLVNFALSR